MKTEKMSLSNIQGKLSRTEMRNIMAGSTSPNCKGCMKGGQLWGCYDDGKGHPCSNDYCGTLSCNGL